MGSCYTRYGILLYTFPNYLEYVKLMLCVLLDFYAVRGFFLLTCVSTIRFAYDLSLSLFIAFKNFIYLISKGDKIS